MRYVAYLSSALMVVLSFIPLHLIKGAFGHRFDDVIKSSVLKECSFLFPAFFIPILAIFLSAVLIIWTHKEQK